MSSLSASRAARAQLHQSWLPDLLFIITVVVVAWCWYYGKFTLADLQVPPAYGGDGLGVLARIKAYAAGEIFPLIPNEVATLNAPFTANWNDYPIEDFIYFIPGVLSALFGLAPGINLYLILLQVGAGVSFYAAGRALALRRDYVVAGAILFALAPFAFHRGMGHISLTAYWHLPLLLVVLVWLAEPQRWGKLRRTALLGAVLVAFLAGGMNPYYFFFFLTCVAAISGGALVNGSRERLSLAAVIIAAGIAGFVTAHLDTFTYTALHGNNSAAVQRDLGGLITWGLRLPDLFFPAEHRSDAIKLFFANLYYSRAPQYFLGESQSAYLGIIGGIGLAGLLTTGALRIAAGQPERVPPWFWVAGFCIALGITGGLNYLFGATGFVLFRGTNRFSIILLCIALLFLCETLPRTRAGRLPLLLPLLMLTFGLWDQIPPRMPELNAANEAAWKSDRQFAQALESHLPPGAMLFQLPVKQFPETGRIHQMRDYDHLRPYLFSEQLRFSYGTIKGRGDEQWQQEIAQMGPEQMVNTLEQYGFAGVVLVRYAYPDGGAKLIGELTAGGAKPMLQNEAMVALALHPRAEPIQPSLRPAEAHYSKEFFQPEIQGGVSWRWAGAEARLTIEPRRHYPGGYRKSAGDKPAGYRFRATVEVRDARNLWVAINGEKRQLMAAGEGAGTRRELALQLPPGRNTLEFFSDSPARAPGGADQRLLAFRIIDPELSFVTGPAAP